MYNADVCVAQSGTFVRPRQDNMCVSSPHISCRAARHDISRTWCHRMDYNRCMMRMKATLGTKSANGGHQILVRSTSQRMSTCPPVLMGARRRQMSSFRNVAFSLKHSAVVHAAATAAMGAHDESSRMSLEDLQDLIGTDW